MNTEPVPNQRPVSRPASEVVQQTQVVAPRDRVRWGPIWAGLLTAIGVFLLLSLLATAIGAQTFNPGTSSASNTAKGVGIATAIIGLISFLIGGWVASRASAVVGRGNGLLNGWLVWALGVVVILVLAAFGLGQLFGLADNVIGRTGIPSNVNVPNVQPGQAASNIKSAALTGFISLLLPAITAAIGGWLGAREHYDVDTAA